MTETVFKIEILKKEEGIFKDSVRIAGTEVEVLGMIEKVKIILEKTRSKIINDMNNKAGKE